MFHVSKYNKYRFEWQKQQHMRLCSHLENEMFFILLADGDRWARRWISFFVFIYLRHAKFIFANCIRAIAT